MNIWIERGYSYLPVWAQNLALTAFGIRYRSHRLGGNFDQYVAGFRLRDRWNTEQMHDYVQQQLRRVLMEAFGSVPYYRKVWSAAGITPADLRSLTLRNLSQLPVTPKEQLRAHPAQFLAEHRRQREKIYSNPTTGSTGTPINAVWSSDVRRRCIAAREVRSFGWAGTSVRRPRAMIGGRPIVQNTDSRGPFYRYNYIERQVYFSAYHLSADRAADYVAGLRKYQPRVLTGYAHCYYFLARHMLDQGLRLGYKPDALVLSSEPLSAEMKAVIGEAFQARAFEEYSSTENCFLATECEAGRLHVSPDFGVLEIVDAEGRPAPAGMPGKVLATGLLNPVQPLIRYQVGDVAAWSTERCPCGRDHLPVLAAVEGRLEDVVVGPDGREMVRFHSVFVNVRGLVEAQVIQETIDRIRIKVVTREEFGAEEVNLMRQRLVQRLGAVQVTVERVAEIPRNQRGKFRSVVSLLPEEEKQRMRVLR